jgi:predicted GIY-YIG superfamily endonuclease
VIIKGLYQIISNMRHGVYVLALRNGGYYVGRSQDIDTRIRQHHEGTGSAWCRHQGGVLGEVASVHVGSTSDVASWEMNETVAQMLIHGFEKVRGWEFTNCAPLTSQECDTIKTIVMGQGNMCRRCGGEGHFAMECTRSIQMWLQDLEKLQAMSLSPAAPAKNVIAMAAMAYKSFQADTSLPVLHACAARHASTRSGVPNCTRCGRDSHTAAKCFAHRHFTGAEIKPRSPKGCAETVRG